MTTLTEYAEAADLCQDMADTSLDSAQRLFELAATVLRQLAEGKVLCEGEQAAYEFRYDNEPWVLSRDSFAKSTTHYGYQERALYAE